MRMRQNSIDCVASVITQVGVNVSFRVGTHPVRSRENFQSVCMTTSTSSAFLEADRLDNWRSELMS